MKSTNILIFIAVTIFTVLLFLPMEFLDYNAFIIILVALSLILTFVIFIPVYVKDKFIPAIIFSVMALRLSAAILSCKNIFVAGEITQSIIAARVSSFSFSNNPSGALIVLINLLLLNYYIVVKYISKRVEITARFYIDTMPGIQMSVDSDLSAGVIDEKTAKRKRDDIRRKVDTFGAIDGLFKLVRIETIYVYAFIILVLFYNVATSIILTGTLNHGNIIATHSAAGIIIVLSIGIPYLSLIGISKRLKVC